MDSKWNVKIDGRQMTEPEIIMALLKERGISNYSSFLSPTEDNLVPFDKMSGLQKGYEMIMNAIERDNKFIIHFDVDVDGATAGAIMTNYLRHYTDNIGTLINEGKEHGVENFDITKLSDNVTLIVVDSLNNDPSVYKRILDTGCKLIVCDHHVIEDRLLNAKLPFCLISSANNYPNPALSGAGVVFKFCQYIDEMTWNDFADDLWDLAATGIIGDMCDVSEKSLENRYICYKGFNNLNNVAISKINGSFGYDSKAVSFGISPLINAANRMNDNKDAMNLFIEQDPKKVNAIIKNLKNCKEYQREIVDEMMEKLYQQGDEQLDNKCMYFFIDSDFTVGGLIGNKLLERYKRPLFILHEKDGKYVGSMRAIGVENFMKIINDTGLGFCAGHELAAGFSISINDFKLFKQRIENALKDVAFQQTINVDLQIDAEQVTDVLIGKIKDLNKISGTGFRPITVMIDNITDFTIGQMSGGKHLKIENPNVTLIKWNYSSWSDLENNDFCSVSGVGQLDAGFFGRRYYRQLILDDVKLEGEWD